MYQIIKRDGRKEPFDGQKIMDCILLAFKGVDGEISEYAETKAYNIAQYIEEKAKEKEFTIEEIQDMVEHGLMSTKRKDVAAAYIKYREKRNIERNKNSKLRQTVLEKLTALAVKNQNANVDEASFGGRTGEANSVQLKDIALYNIMSKKSRKRHLNNEIYIHKLNCA